MQYSAVDGSHGIGVAVAVRVKGMGVSVETGKGVWVAAAVSDGVAVSKDSGAGRLHETQKSATRAGMSRFIFK
jgi:hypothetical protein